MDAGVPPPRRAARRDAARRDAVSGGTGQHLVYLADASTGAATAVLPYTPGTGGQQIKTMAFSPGGKTPATSDNDGSAYVWRVR